MKLDKEILDEASATVLYDRILMLLFAIGLANAQSASSAQISGTVVDPQGAVVPGAKVTATNQATGTGRSVTTTSTGNYVIPNLQPGTYDVAVDCKRLRAGFNKKHRAKPRAIREISASS